MSLSYRDAASGNVPAAQRQRHERLLALIRGSDAGQAATDLVTAMAADGERDYSYGLCTKDLTRRERRERRPARPPEVDLVDVRTGTQELVALAQPVARWRR